LFPPGTPKVTMSWVLLAAKKNYRSTGGISKLSIFLRHEKPLNVSLNFYAKSVVKLLKTKGCLKLKRAVTPAGPPLLNKFTTGLSLGGKFLNVSDLIKYLDEEGSLNFKVETDFYVNSDGIAEISLLEDNKKTGDSGGRSEMDSVKIRREIVLNQVASLLGDEVTSDVIVSVRDTENIEIGKFLCHSAILSGKLTF